MKKLLSGIFFLLVISCAGCSRQASTLGDVTLYGYTPTEQEEILVENTYLEFHFIPSTAGFYIIDKATGNRWDSNPVTADQDALANSTSKDQLKSQLILQYGTAAGTVTTLNSYGFSVLKGLYTYEVLENGIKVMYTIGDIEREYILPTAVPESRMSEFFDRMDKSSKRKIDEYYRKYDINNLRSTDDKAALLKQYPDLEQECIYVLRDTIQEYLKIQIEDMFEELGYTTEDYEADKARYSSTKAEDSPTYNVSVIYELDGKDLLIKVPFNEICYKKDYPLTKLYVSPYFGAGSTEDEGFLLVPSGTGALIHFNNGKQNLNTYYGNIYGWDYGIDREAVVNDISTSLPVYGVNRNGAQVLCVLEEGASYASLEADVSGRLHSFNYAAPLYTITHNELMDISAKSDTEVVIYEDQLPKETIVQRYIFPEGSGYSDMAVAYRNYLLNINPDMAQRNESTVPVTVEILGAIDKVQKIAGLPIDASYALTTYDEAGEILTELKDYGWENINLKYTGWFNKSINHSVPSDVKLISKLGSKKDFKKLISLAKQSGSQLYLESEFQFIVNASMFDGFSINADAARFLNRKRAEVYPYSFLWFGKDMDIGTMRYLARPEYTMKLIDDFVKEIKPYQVDGISVGSIGEALGADYYEKRSVSREANMNMQVNKLKELKSNGIKLMMNSGNAYVLPYSDFILGVPIDYKSMSIIDEDVPFFEIAMHGLVPYAGEAANLAGDYETNLLKSAETGAGLYYVFMEKEAEVLQDTEYTYYFGANYSRFKETANQTYQQFEKLTSTYNQFITDHRTVEDGLTLTVYEDGTKVIVNYNNYDCSYEGNNIGPRSFIVVQ